MPALRGDPVFEATSSACACPGKDWRVGWGRFYNSTVRGKTGGREIGGIRDDNS